MKQTTILFFTLFLMCNVYGQNGLDLPVSPPKLGGQSSTDLPIEPDDDDDGDDPRDTPPPTFYGEEIDTENDTIFYVIDRSGSMAQDYQASVNSDGNLVLSNRLERAKAELSRSISSLSENFKFNIIAYDCGILQFSSVMVDATDETKRAALNWIRSLSASGATGTGPSTSAALAVRENRTVILLTDGAPNCGAPSLQSHRELIRSNNLQGAVINVFGISASGSYRAFCQGVASDSGGSYFDIP